MRVTNRAYIDGKWRVLTTTPRLIERGKNAGQVEVTISAPSVTGDGWMMRDRKRIVYPQQIRQVA